MAPPSEPVPHSYLCCDNYCKRYMAGGRGTGDPDSSTNHIGFRCVKDAR